MTRWHQIRSTSDDKLSHVSVLDKNVYQTIHLTILVCDSSSLSMLGRPSFPVDMSIALKCHISNSSLPGQLANTPP